MQRKLASIQRIDALTPIDGADRIERAHVLGWTVVVRKGEFQEGDLDFVRERERAEIINTETGKLETTQRPTSGLALEPAQEGESKNDS